MWLNIGGVPIPGGGTWCPGLGTRWGLDGLGGLSNLGDPGIVFRPFSLEAVSDDIKGQFLACCSHYIEKYHFFLKSSFKHLQQVGSCVTKNIFPQAVMGMFVYFIHSWISTFHLAKGDKCRCFCLRV